MRGFLRRLPFVLVLLSASFLAWQAFQSADAYEQVVKNHIRTRLDAAEGRVQRVLAAEVAALETRSRESFAQAASDLRDRIVHMSLEDAMSLVPRRGPLRDDGSQHSEFPVADVRLVNATGASIYPVEFVPEDARSRQANLASLLRDLRARADKRLFGQSDPEGALQIWTDARERFNTPNLQATIDVEIALLRVRFKGAGNAPTELMALEDLWPPATLRAVGRPFMLLLMVAAQDEATLRCRVTDAYRKGWFKVTPLTDEERARARDILRKCPDVDQREFASFFARPEVNPMFEEEVAHGARLRFFVAADQVGQAIRRRVETNHEWAGFNLFREGAGFAAYVVKSDERLVPFSYLGKIYGGIGVRYENAERDLRESRKRRHIWVGIVAALFLFAVVGLESMRRALAREQQARRLRDDFIANVTHEVRTPLTSVLMHSEMLAEDDLSVERKRTYGRVVQAEGARLASLVEDLLDFSALEQGTQVLEPAPIDVNAAAENAIEPFRILAQREDADVSIELPEGGLAAFADPAATSRILANLIGNAWKHGRPSRDGYPGRIRVAAFETAGEPVVEVRDDGPGIPAGERALVFERFARGKAAARVQGTGLGLALSRELARAMGGDLTVLEEGDETVFRLRLKAVPEIDA